MPQINTKIIDVLTKWEFDVDLPANMAMGQLIPRLLQKLDINRDGHFMLQSEKSGTIFESVDTLRSKNVADGDIFWLIQPQVAQNKNKSKEIVLSSLFFRRKGFSQSDFQPKKLLALLMAITLISFSIWAVRWFPKKTEISLPPKTEQENVHIVRQTPTSLDNQAIPKSPTRTPNPLYHRFFFPLLRKAQLSCIVTRASFAMRISPQMSFNNRDEEFIVNPNRSILIIEGKSQKSDGFWFEVLKKDESKRYIRQDFCKPNVSLNLIPNFE